jgi:hypothetical protein
MVRFENANEFFEFMAYVLMKQFLFVYVKCNEQIKNHIIINITLLP